MPQYTYPYAMNGINTATANPTVQMGYPYPNVPTYTYATPYQGQNFSVNQPVQNQMQQTAPVNQMTLPTIHADIIQADEEQARDYSIVIPQGYNQGSQMFMSKDEKYIYVKTAYANGGYDFETYVKDKKEASPIKPSDDQNDYITREEFEKRLAEVAYRPKYKNKSPYAKKEENADE